MKIRSLSSAAIVAVLTLGVVASIPTSASATAGEFETTTGAVKVTEGGDEPVPTNPFDPEKPDTDLPTVDPDGPTVPTNPDLGALMIERVSTLEFGEIKTSANDVTKYAKPASFIEGGNKITRGALVQWRDIRAGDTFGYDITAQMTQQFTAGSNQLTNSTIDYSNGMSVAQGSNKNVVPSTVNGAFQLTEAANDAKTVVTASKANKEGKGRYSLEFGQSAGFTGTGTPDTADKSVKLTVPASTASNMVTGDYVAKVMWKIVAAK